MRTASWCPAPRALAVLMAVFWLALTSPVQAQPAGVGQWAQLGTWPISATHTHLLPNGKVLFFGEFEQGEGAPYIWDPATGALSAAAVPDYNIFCAGHSFLADGRLLVTGGHEDSHVGYPYASIYDTATNSWSRTPDMNDNRWYPTNTTLANGDVAVLSGETHESGMTNMLVQVYEPQRNAWRNLTTAERDLAYYPRMFLAPNGKLFMASPRRVSMYLDTNGTGTWFEWGRGLFGGRPYGGAVYLDGKVLMVGGGDPPTATAELFDLNAPTPVWRYTASMSLPRRQHNTTIMPDGTVLVTGGSSKAGFNESSGAVKSAESYNPATETWTSFSSATYYHGYHSTSLLLPDGRVLHAGGKGVRTAEIFSPPYLFKGPRPTLASAPDVVEPGTTFTVSTPDAAGITKVTLIALGSVTHAMDESQRLLTLSYTKGSGSLTLTAPESNVLAPPGPYLLFLVNGQGVPSVGKIVRVATVPPKLKHILSLSDVWKYDDKGVDRGTDWLDRAYDDSAWKSGPGQFGYGDEDEGTVVTKKSPSQPTVYFRKKFTLERPVTQARLEALYDDGVAVWINGALVFSRNVGEGLEYAKYASGSTSNAWERATLTLSPNPFVVGENIITAVVKQVSGTSDDLTFAVGLDVKTDDSGPIPDALVLVSPNGGESLVSGSTATLRWNSNGNIGAVDLAYSKDDGATWTPIAVGVGNTGTYAWTVPSMTTQQGRVRISRAGGGAPMDESDHAFTITNSINVTVIPLGSVWKYQASGADPGAAWNTAGYDDSAWPSGAGELGYGDGDEATVLPRTDPSQTSVYFRKKLTVSGTVTSATLGVRYDDGIVVYVNGQQVLARNMDSGTAHAKYASASVENAAETVSLPPGAFAQGENTVGVMVKQAGRTSPDLSFDLSLTLGISASPVKAAPSGR